MKNHENDTTEGEKLAAADSAIPPKLEEPKAPQDAGLASPGLLDRLRNMFGGVGRLPVESTRDRSRDRTRSLLLLIGGSVGAVLLFIAVFSTPPRPSLQESRSQGGPNLGRPAVVPSAPAPGPQGSVTPLLTADVRSADLTRDQLSPSDISGTSRRSNDDTERAVATPELTARRTPSSRPSPSLPRPVDPPARPSDADDPLAQYRIDAGVGAPTYQYGVAPPSAAGTRTPDSISFGGLGGQAQNAPRNATAAPRSSIVFVREGRASVVVSTPATETKSLLPQVDSESLLPPGTRLIARVDAAATSALETPVVASIEYNYERDGVVAVPAGSKVIGAVRQASADGYVDVRFHTLQTPDGRDMPIEATATTFDLKPLKGTVSGKNTGKNILSRTLSGVGTIAAYVVGGGGGLSGAVTGETLLRDRVAGNIALVGEEQLRNAAYAQRITVTLPANMRFYVVLQKGTVSVSAPPAAPAPAVAPAAPPQRELPSLQELRELMDLRREINRMYQESNSGLGEVLQ